VRTFYGLLFLMGLATHAFADRVFVDPAKGPGMDEADLGTLTELIKTAIAPLNAHQLVDDVTKAEIVLSPQLLKLGSSYIVKIDKRKNGQVIYSTQLKAGHIEELDKVAGRVTMSALADQRAETHARVGEITDFETTEGMQRKPSRTSGYFGFGTVNFAHLNAGGFGIAIEAAKVWDLNDVFIRLFGDFAAKNGALLLQGGLGVSFFFSRSDVAPYLGADFGYGFTRAANDTLSSSETANGFVLGGGPGVVLFRTNTVNLDIGARAGILLSDTIYGHPSFLIFKIGLNY
jgi:hypothetical protein